MHTRVAEKHEPVAGCRPRRGLRVMLKARVGELMYCGRCRGTQRHEEEDQAAILHFEKSRAVLDGTLNPAPFKLVPCRKRAVRSRYSSRCTLGNSVVIKNGAHFLSPPALPRPSGSPL